MKILWVKTDYLHPTDRGGQIRSLEMLKRLHARHEVHFLTLEDPANKLGPALADQYCSRHFAVPHHVTPKGSPRFAWELLRSCNESLPLAIGRWTSERMRQMAKELQAREGYDVVLCDFLAPAASLDDWGHCVLFQHNVEALIWERHYAAAPTPLHRWYFRSQAQKMARFEQEASRGFGRVLCVSAEDAEITRKRYGRADAEWIPTGVDAEYFKPKAQAKPVADLVFLGSMDWMPNIDGVRWFVNEFLPLIWAKRPETTLAVVGRKPGEAIRALSADRRIIVSGTVDDVRPWLWGSSISVVPLRVGGGTRLKIYESMAAGVPTVSTRIGAEGLDVRDGFDIRLADSPEEFAAACLSLLEDEEARREQALQGLLSVQTRHSWEGVVRRFELLITPPAKA